EQELRNLGDVFQRVPREEQSRRLCDVRIDFCAIWAVAILVALIDLGALITDQADQRERPHRVEPERSSVEHVGGSRPDRRWRWQHRSDSGGSAHGADRAGPPGQIPLMPAWKL